MIYTGIGARATPNGILLTMTSIARLLDRKGYALRSGAAQGADSAFEEGVELMEPEIYLPWRGFSSHNSKYTDPKPEAFAIAEKYHPAWGRLSPAVRKLMARNVHQILGWDLRVPSDFIVCWTADGKASGGTGQALRIGTACRIPIYNLYNDTDVKRLVNERLNGYF
jgi:hypothetical protein